MYRTINTVHKRTTEEDQNKRTEITSKYSSNNLCTNHRDYKISDRIKQTYSRGILRTISIGKYG